MKLVRQSCDKILYCDKTLLTRTILKIGKKTVRNSYKYQTDLIIKNSSVPNQLNESENVISDVNPGMKTIG